MTMRKHRKSSRRWLIVAAVTTALTIGPALGAIGGSYMSPAEQASDNIAIGGCVIRFDTLNWNGTKVLPRVHANATHHCVGVAGVHVSSGGALVVDFDNPGSSAVVTLIVGADETFARRGITAGPSGGGSSMSIVCYRNGTQIPANSKTLYSSTANLWLFMAWERTP